MEGITAVVIIIALILYSCVGTCIRTKMNVWRLGDPEISRVTNEDLEDQIAGSKVFDDLPDSNLKTKAFELKDAYNERDANLAKAQVRLELMVTCNRCSEETAKKLQTIIDSLRTQNKELKQQYSVLLQRAEISYANRVVSGQESLDKTLLEDADALLKKQKDVTLVAGDEGRVLTTITMASNVGKQPATPSQAPANQAQPSQGSANQSQSSNGASSSNQEGLSELIDQVRNVRAGGFRDKLLRYLEAIRDGAGVNDELPGMKGNLALHYACALGHLRATQWLVEHGANVNARTDKGAYPADCAETPEVRRYIIKNGGKQR